MRRSQISLPFKMRCEQTEEREREHWLEAMVDLNTVKKISGQADKALVDSLKEERRQSNEPN